MAHEIQSQVYPCQQFLAIASEPANPDNLQLLAQKIFAIELCKHIKCRYYLAKVGDEKKLAGTFLSVPFFFTCLMVIVYKLVANMFH